MSQRLPRSSHPQTEIHWGYLLLQLVVLSAIMVALLKAVLGNTGLRIAVVLGGILLTVYAICLVIELLVRSRRSTQDRAEP